MFPFHQFHGDLIFRSESRFESSTSAPPVCNSRLARPIGQMIDSVFELSNAAPDDFHPRILLRAQFVSVDKHG